jgi:hypothetical protein
MPLGGSTTINANPEPQLRELMRITPNITALIDSERAEGEDAARERIAFQQTCKSLGMECHILERRAIENYFPERAIQAVKSDSYRALGAHEKREDVQPHWGKSENWRIAAEMSNEELVETGDLHEFLSRLAQTVS